MDELVYVSSFDLQKLGNFALGFIFELFTERFQLFDKGQEQLSNQSQTLHPSDKEISQLIYDDGLGSAAFGLL